MLVAMVSNQDLLRYIYYLDDNPLSSSNSDITSTLIGTHIILTLFNTDVLDSQNIKQVYVFFNPYNGNLVPSPVYSDVYTMEIVIPSQYWLMDGKIRWARIANEIGKSIDGLYIAGIGKVNITNYRTFRVNNMYMGVQLQIGVGSVGHF